MLRRATQWMFLAVLATLTPTSVHAATYDLIFADSMDVYSPPEISGFNTGLDVAMIVNTGPTNIEAAELFGANFSATTTDPLVTAFPFINNPGPPVAPILPHEAVGTILPGSPLLDWVLPGETARSTYPLQVFGLIVNYPAGYTGTVVIYTTMAMGIDVLQYYTVLVIQPGAEFNVSTAHASRGTSIPQPTPVRASSWGAIKKLYR